MSQSRFAGLLGCGLIAVGCNALFEIEETKLVLEPPAAAGEAGEGAVAVGGRATGARSGAAALGGKGGGGHSGTALAGHGGESGKVGDGGEGGDGGDASVSGGVGGLGVAAAGSGGAGGTVDSSAGGAAGSAGADCAGSNDDCSEGTCEDGTQECAGNALRSCEDGSWVESLCTFEVCGSIPGCWECDPNAPGVCASGNVFRACSLDGKPTSTVCIDECTPAGCKECEPFETLCVDSRHRKTCGENGAWEAPEACVHQTCVGVACVGECEPGETVCSEDGDLGVCDPGGHFDYEACEAPEYICRVADGASACVPNPPYRVGNPELLSGAPALPAGDTIYLFRLPEFESRAGVSAAEVTGLGLLASASPPGLYAKLALYRETNGFPATLVTSSTGNIPVNTNESGNQAAGNVNEALVQAGARYWLGVIFSSTAGMAFMPTEAGSSMAYQADGQDYALGFPSTLSAESLREYLRVEMNLFFVVRDRRP